MWCNCDITLFKPYKNNSDAWNTISFETLKCNNANNPALKVGEGIVVGQAIYYDANELTGIYAPGLRLAGISHVKVNAVDNIADANTGLGTCTPNVLEGNSEALFRAYFEDGVDASTLQVGSYYLGLAGGTNQIDSSTAAAVNPGNAFLLKEIIKTDKCGTEWAFVACC